MNGLSLHNVRARQREILRWRPFRSAGIQAAAAALLARSNAGNSFNGFL